jgi:hypothetical protein
MDEATFGSVSLGSRPMMRRDRKRAPCFSRLVPKARHLRVQGYDVDPCLCVQRFCPFRGCYVILSRKDSNLIIETARRLPELELLGPDVEI